MLWADKTAFRYIKIQFRFKGGETMKQYIAIPGPMNIQVSKGNTQQAFESFSRLINEQVSQGWEYHSMETITVTENPGCFQQPVMTSYYMLIFFKEV